MYIDILSIIQYFLAVISGNFNRLETNTRNQLETLTHKDKLVIKIDKTDPEVMKQVVVFMYTGKCDLNEGNGKNFIKSIIYIFQILFFSLFTS